MGATVEYNAQQVRLLQNFESSLQLLLFRLSFASHQQSTIRYTRPDRRVCEGKQWRGVHNDPVKQIRQLPHQIGKAARLQQLERILGRIAGRQEPEIRTLQTVHVRARLAPALQPFPKTSQPSQSKL